MEVTPWQRGDGSADSESRVSVIENIVDDVFPVIQDVIAPTTLAIGHVITPLLAGPKTGLGLLPTEILSSLTDFATSLLPIILTLICPIVRLDPDKIRLFTPPAHRLTRRASTCFRPCAL